MRNSSSHHGHMISPPRVQFGSTNMMALALVLILQSAFAGTFNHQPDSLDEHVKPAPLRTDRDIVNLPSPVQKTCVGGGGRYLILHLPRQRTLAVFDSNRAKIVKYLPLSEESIYFTAGLEKLFVALPANNVLQRWSLKTFEREAAVPSPVPVKGLAMGSTTLEPLIVQSADDAELVFLDPETFKKSDYRVAHERNIGRGFHPASELRVSANGQVTTGSAVFVRAGRNYHLSPATGDSLPSPDGRVLYGHEQFYTAEGRPLGPAFRAHRQRFWFIPAVHGPYALFYKQEGEQPKVRLGLYVQGETRLLAAMPEVDGLNELVDWHSGVSMPIEQHLFLIPDAELLVFIPASSDRLVLYRVNIEQLLERADVDYLYVKSVPPPNFTPGKEYRYQLTVRSRTGGVKFRLDSGPEKMRLSQRGLQTWKVPLDFTAKEVDVIVTLTDRSGQERFHTFTATSTARESATASR